VALIAGVDEVGKGALAGPLTVGIAIVEDVFLKPEGLKDSKRLKESQRERLYPILKEVCVDWSIGHARSDECDALGMGEAQLLAASRALGALRVQPDEFLIDGPWNFLGLQNCSMHIKGDSRFTAIMAAAVLAKVTRDRLMVVAAETYPGYGFETNKGYGTEAHLEAIRRLGPCEIHRTSWKPFRRIARGQTNA
jgi:ribonuclease HII